MLSITSSAVRLVHNPRLSLFALRSRPPGLCTARETVASRQPTARLLSSCLPLRQPPYVWHKPDENAENATFADSVYHHRASAHGPESAEPGVDPRRHSTTLQYGHIHQECAIEICDFSGTQLNARRLVNADFVALMQDPVAHQRESWAKVRWINIGGMSWDVLSALAIRYDLHPLALEDVLHQPRNRGLPSKVDYYSKHLFLRVLNHSLTKGEDCKHHPLLVSNPAVNHSRSNVQKSSTDFHSLSSSPSLRSKEGDNMEVSDENRFEESRASDKPQRTFEQTNYDGNLHSSAGQNQHRHARAITELNDGTRVGVKIEPMCIFLLRDGTVITINRSPDLKFTAPIRELLAHRDTGLRSTADPSLLIHGLLDLTVDRVIEVVDEYQAKILELEHDTLVYPKMRVVRDLHILQGDLIQHKRTLEPIKKVVFGLMRYDLDRCAALVPDEDKNPSKPVKGYMSENTKIYLADLVDHMDYILTSLDMFTNISENLINFTFNMANHQMNETMRRLTLATIIFLPLTILTGYFGMNFDPMPSVQENSDLLFWKIAIPTMFAVVVAFTYPDITRKFRRFQKRMISRRARKTMMTGNANNGPPYHRRDLRQL